MGQSSTSQGAEITASFLSPCPSLQHEEMINCCNPRTINVVFSLLIILAELGSSCKFEHNPLSSHYKEKINELKKHLPLDYPVQDFSNLLLDDWCSPLWELFYLYTEMREVEKKSGSELAKKIRFASIEFKFVEECSFNKSIIPCATQKPIELILNRTIDLLDELALEERILNDYSNCTLIQYKPDDSPKTAQSEADETIQQPSHRFYFVSWIAVGVFLVILIQIFVIVCRKSQETGA